MGCKVSNLNHTTHNSHVAYMESRVLNPSHTTHYNHVSPMELRVSNPLNNNSIILHTHVNQQSQIICSIGDIHKLMLLETLISTGSIFQYNYDKKAAAHNLEILKENNFDFNRIWEKNLNSADRPGFEFRSQEQLCQIF